MSVQSLLDQRQPSAARSSQSSRIMSKKGGDRGGDGPCHMLERPPPPVVGKVTHHTIELSWEDALKKAMENSTRADGRTQVCVQEEEKNGGWGTIYTGYSKKHVCSGLECWSPYKYRIRFKNNHGYSDWSSTFTVSTCKEPMCGEHLHKAVLLEDIKKAEFVLDSGELQSVDILDKYGHSALMQAAQKGTTDFIELLVSKGADVNLANESGKTALMLASFAGKVDAVKELRHHGAKYEAQDKGGSTAIHWAMDGKNKELIDWMIDDGCNLEATDFNDWTPLLRVAAVGGDREVAAALVRSGANVNKKDKDHKTALMIAVVNGHQALVELLLEKGADLSIQNEYGKTAYEMAIACEKRRVCKVIEEYMEKNGIKSNV